MWIYSLKNNFVVMLKNEALNVFSLFHPLTLNEYQTESIRARLCKYSDKIECYFWCSHALCWTNQHAREDTVAIKIYVTAKCVAHHNQLHVQYIEYMYLLIC